MSPIGAGEMNNVWSAVAPDWSADANTVAIVTGVLNGMVNVFGCVAGGRALDHVGTGGMLQTDALAAILFIVVALFVLHKVNVTRASCLADGNSRVRQNSQTSPVSLRYSSTTFSSDPTSCRTSVASSASVLRPVAPRVLLL